MTRCHFEHVLLVPEGVGPGAETSFEAVVELEEFEGAVIFQSAVGKTQ